MKKGTTYRANFDGCANFLKFTGVIEHINQGVLKYASAGVFEPVEIHTLRASDDGLVRVLLPPHPYGIPLFEVEDTTRTAYRVTVERRQNEEVLSTQTKIVMRDKEPKVGDSYPFLADPLITETVIKVELT